MFTANLDKGHFSNHHTQPQCYIALKHAQPSELAQCFLIQPRLNIQAVGKRQIVCLTECKVNDPEPILNTVLIPIRDLKACITTSIPVFGAPIRIVY